MTIFKAKFNPSAKFQFWQSFNTGWGYKEGFTQLNIAQILTDTFSKFTTEHNTDL